MEKKKSSDQSDLLRTSRFEHRANWLSGSPYIIDHLHSQGRNQQNPFVEISKR